ncbi:MAG TPA: hypothetical protein PLD37_11120, partial [Usitatibacteraceae bacterium]|nr:hypothetical protein [Usitatibacteraceae bacterium]
VGEPPPTVPDVAKIVVAISGAYLVALGLAALAAPARARRFLGAFASTATAHFAELVVRIVVGAAFVTSAPRLPMGAVFSIAGWVLIVSTAVLLVVPWRRHRQFATASVERASRHITLIGIASCAMGALVIAAVVRGQ